MIRKETNYGICNELKLTVSLENICTGIELIYLKFNKSISVSISLHFDVYVYREKYCVIYNVQILCI